MRRRRPSTEERRSPAPRPSRDRPRRPPSRAARGACRQRRTRAVPTRAAPRAATSATVARTRELFASVEGATSPRIFVSSVVFAAVFVAGASCAPSAAANARSASPCVTNARTSATFGVLERLDRPARRRGSTVDLRDPRRRRLRGTSRDRARASVERAAEPSVRPLPCSRASRPARAIALSDASGSSGSRLGPAGRSKNASFAASFGAASAPTRHPRSRRGARRRRCRPCRDRQRRRRSPASAPAADRATVASNATAGSGAVSRTTTMRARPRPAGTRCRSRRRPSAANLLEARDGSTRRLTPKRRAGRDDRRVRALASAASEEDELARRRARLSLGSRRPHDRKRVLLAVAIEVADERENDSRPPASSFIPSTFHDVALAGATRAAPRFQRRSRFRPWAMLSRGNRPRPFRPRHPSPEGRKGGRWRNRGSRRDRRPQKRGEGQGNGRVDTWAVRGTENQSTTRSAYHGQRPSGVVAFRTVTDGFWRVFSPGSRPLVQKTAEARTWLRCLAAALVLFSFVLTSSSARGLGETNSRELALRALEQAERDDAAFAFAPALVHYEEALRLDPTMPRAMAAEMRAKTLRGRAEGAYAPLVVLERVRRDPNLASDATTIDALLAASLRFPPGVVRVEAWVLVAEAYHSGYRDATRHCRSGNALPTTRPPNRSSRRTHSVRWRWRALHRATNLTSPPVVGRRGKRHPSATRRSIRVTPNG